MTTTTNLIKVFGDLHGKREKNSFSHHACKRHKQFKRQFLDFSLAKFR